MPRDHIRSASSPLQRTGIRMQLLPPSNSLAIYYWNSVSHHSNIQLSIVLSHFIGALPCFLLPRKRHSHSHCPCPRRQAIPQFRRVPYDRGECLSRDNSYLRHPHRITIMQGLASTLPGVTTLEAGACLTRHAPLTKRLTP